MAKLLIVGLPEGPPTPYDGTYLVAYDPDTMGLDPWGRPMLATIVVTEDPEQALNLPAVDLLELWRKDSMTLPPRADGRPQRPLTAFSVSIEN